MNALWQWVGRYLDPWMQAQGIDRLRFAMALLCEPEETRTQERALAISDALWRARYPHPIGRQCRDTYVVEGGRVRRVG